MGVHDQFAELIASARDLTGHEHTAECPACKPQVCGQCHRSNPPTVHLVTGPSWFARVCTQCGALQLEHPNVHASLR